jgi:hypothetical protein
LEYGTLPDLVIRIKKKTDGSAALWSTADFNDRLADFYTEHGVLGACTITDAQLHRIRERVRELFDAWIEVPPGESLELLYSRP